VASCWHCPFDSSISAPRLTNASLAKRNFFFLFAL
jgi:hypothetical protein